MDAPASTPLSPPGTPGNPFAVSSRVQSIEHILQVRGAFERQPVPVEAPFHVEMSIPVAKAEIVDRDQVMVWLELALEARGKLMSGVLPSGSPLPQVDTPVPPPLVATASAAFVVTYVISPGERPSESDLQAFAAANGLFNVWPFWREFIANVLPRTGLPIYIAPVLKLKPDGQPEGTVPDGASTTQQEHRGSDR
jgi:hypothetical protein